MYDWSDIEKRFGPLVWRTANRLLSDYADASDCYQEVFLAAVKETRRRRVENWPSLLRRLTTQRAIDRLRQRGRQAKRTVDLHDLSQVESHCAEPAKHAEAEELMETVRRALAKLPAKQAEVFWLRWVEQMAYEEIAGQLGIKANAVGVLLYRARSSLQEKLSRVELSKPNE